MTSKPKGAILDWSLPERFRVHRLPEKLAANGWRTLLQFWGNLINNYSFYDRDTIESDVPYWYGERPLTGLLAAAAWMMPDGWSLEEFSTVRGEGKKSGRGRGDLWIGWGKTTYTIEAKISWCADGPGEAHRDILKKIRRAAGQLVTLKAEYAPGTKIALCYAVPYFIPSTSTDCDKDANRFFKALTASFKGPDCILASYLHPKPPTDPEDRQKHIYPGVLLVGKVQESLEAG